MYISGEYWIQNGHVNYADGDIGDSNHEMIARDHVAYQHLDKILQFANELEIQTSRANEEYPAATAEEILNDIYQKLFSTTNPQNPKKPLYTDNQQIIKEIEKQVGIDEETYYLLSGSNTSDPRLYVMKHDGWMAVRGNNVEFYGMNPQKLRNLVNGFDDILEQEGAQDINDEDLELNLYDHQTKKSTMVNLQDMRNGNIYRPQIAPQTKTNYILPSTGEKQYGRELWRGTSENVTFKNWLNLTETELSPIEKSLLGQPKKGSKFNYPSEEEWKIIRPHLVASSKTSNKSTQGLDPELTAYTPGETLTIMNNPKIKAYHQKVSQFKVPKNVDTIILVPCVKSKPWGTSCKSDFYKAYHQIKDNPEFGNLYFVTVSEPLGIVPSEDWENFPQYDNPGLFDDTAMQSSMQTRDWSNKETEIGSKIGHKRIMPFDRDAYNQAINILSDVISSFLKNNKKKRFVSFVADPSGGLTTHSDMLAKASQKSGVSITPFFKKPSAGRQTGAVETIRDYMKKSITELPS